ADGLVEGAGELPRPAARAALRQARAPGDLPEPPPLRWQRRGGGGGGLVLLRQAARPPVAGRDRSPDGAPPVAFALRPDGRRPGQPGGPRRARPRPPAAPRARHLRGRGDRRGAAPAGAQDAAPPPLLGAALDGARGLPAAPLPAARDRRARGSEGARRVGAHHSPPPAAADRRGGGGAAGRPAPRRGG